MNLIHVLGYLLAGTKASMVIVDEVPDALGEKLVQHIKASRNEVPSLISCLTGGAPKGKGAKRRAKRNGERWT